MAWKCLQASTKSTFCIGPPSLLFVKVFDDFLLSRSPIEIQKFHQSISKLFEVGRFSEDTSLVFNRPQIEQLENGEVKVSIGEYMRNIYPLETSQECKKDHDSDVTKTEVTAFLLHIFWAFKREFN